MKHIRISFDLHSKTNRENCLSMDLQMVKQDNHVHLSYFQWLIQILRFQLTNQFVLTLVYLDLNNHLKFRMDIKLNDVRHVV